MKIICSGYRLLFALMTTMSLSPAYAQLQFERKGIVKKEALIVYLVGGQNVLAPPEPPLPDSIDLNGEVIKHFKMGGAEDYFTNLILPNDKRLPNGEPIPIGLHFRDLVGNHPYIYMFNDIYLSSYVTRGSQDEFYQSIGHVRSASEPEPPIDMEELKASNDVFISYNESYVGKFWVLKGEWEAFEVSEKPTFLRGITPSTLQFEHYNVFLLKRIIGVEPVTEVAEIPGHIEAVRGQVPYPKRKNGDLVNFPEKMAAIE